MSTDECVETVPHCWRADLYPPCEKFDDDDRGICVNCGHHEACHERP